MLDFIILMLGLSLLFYVIFAGADFGAGIYEFLCLVKKRSSRKELVEKAIGPIWEANHIWLILVVVILFMGFPEPFSYISTYFHIPITMILIGITLRGTAFAFRHYDPFEDQWQKRYSWLFGVSSVWTSFWQGVLVGSLLNPIHKNATTFQESYVLNWMNPFNFTVGIFVISVYLFLAQNFFLGESKNLKAEIKNSLKKDFWKSLAFVLISGALVFSVGQYFQVPFVKSFYTNMGSLLFMSMTTLLLIPLLWSHYRSFANYSRVIVAIQVTLIFGSVIILKFPDLITFSDGTAMNIYDSASPQNTIKQLFYALVFGVIIIIPPLTFLFRVFKGSKP